MTSSNPAPTDLTKHQELPIAKINSDNPASTSDTASQTEVPSPALNPSSQTSSGSPQAETETESQEQEEEEEEEEEGNGDDAEQDEQDEGVEGSENSEESDSDGAEYPDGSPEQNRRDEKLLKSGAIQRLGQMASAA